eukprot:m.254260 g.254260  ORF g.254260 m.254260 type:complete len:388 (-) comp33913_c0_seq15:130-1293(-)
MEVHLQNVGERHPTIRQQLERENAKRPHVALCGEAPFVQRFRRHPPNGPRRVGNLNVRLAVHVTRESEIANFDVGLVNIVHVDLKHQDVAASQIPMHKIDPSQRVHASDHLLENGDFVVEGERFPSVVEVANELIQRTTGSKLCQKNSFCVSAGVRAGVDIALPEKRDEARVLTQLEQRRDFGRDITRLHNQSRDDHCVRRTRQRQRCSVDRLERSTANHLMKRNTASWDHLAVVLLVLFNRLSQSVVARQGFMRHVDSSDGTGVVCFKPTGDARLTIRLSGFSDHHRVDHQAVINRTKETFRSSLHGVRYRRVPGSKKTITTSNGKKIKIDYLTKKIPSKKMKKKKIKILQLGSRLIPGTLEVKPKTNTANIRSTIVQACASNTKG